MKIQETGIVDQLGCGRGVKEPKLTNYDKCMPENLGFTSSWAVNGGSRNRSGQIPWGLHSQMLGIFVQLGCRWGFEEPKWTDSVGLSCPKALDYCYPVGFGVGFKEARWINVVGHSYPKASGFCLVGLWAGGQRA